MQFESFTKSGHFFAGADLSIPTDPLSPIFAGAGDELVVVWPNNSRSRFKVAEASRQSMTLEGEEHRYRLTLAAAEEKVDEVPAPGFKVNVWVVRTVE